MIVEKVDKLFSILLCVLVMRSGLIFTGSFACSLDLFVLVNEVDSCTEQHLLLGSAWASARILQGRRRLARLSQVRVTQSVFCIGISQLRTAARLLSSEDTTREE